METTIMENQMEKKMENEMETLGPFKGVWIGFCDKHGLPRTNLQVSPS